MDGVEKCLRKGKSEEIYLASHCAVLLLLQLGACSSTSPPFFELISTAALQLYLVLI